MAEVIYSLNGKYFKDYDIFISSSDGLFDGLKPKKQDTFDWAEYSGIASDITQTKRFEPRKFTLTGFVKGTDWNDMRTNFWAVFGDLNKLGRQRLLIEPFGVKTLVYDVINEDNIDVKKTFREGEMYATFTIKLIEQKPIKKIFYTAKNNLQLSFNSPKWVEVNIDGNISNYKGHIVVDKTLTPRDLSKYGFSGRNLLKNTAFKENIIGWFSDGAQGAIISWDSIEKAIYLNNGNNGGSILQFISLNPGKYIISFDVKPQFQNQGSSVRIKTSIQEGDFVPIHTTSQFKRYEILFEVLGVATWVAISANGEQRLLFKNIKLEKGNKVTDWTPAPEEQHFISIAGEIDEITNLTTNAEVLWEKL